jgi:hypothetical protein
VAENANEMDIAVQVLRNFPESFIINILMVCD